MGAERQASGHRGKKRPTFGLSDFSSFVSRGSEVRSSARSTVLTALRNRSKAAGPLLLLRLHNSESTHGTEGSDDQSSTVDRTSDPASLIKASSRTGRAGHPACRRKVDRIGVTFLFHTSSLASR